MWMWKEQKKILDKFYKLYGKFRVASHTQWGWRYFMYPTDTMALTVLKNDGITDRDIMRDEIVIENDLNMRRMNMGLSLKHEKKLRVNGIGYQKWFSGNKSYHIHTHFNELNLIQDTHDLKLLKKAFLLWLYKFDEDKLSSTKLDIQLTGKHLIRLEHSWHPNTMQRKTLYSEHITDNNQLPETVVSYYISEKKKKEQLPKAKYISVFDRPCIMDMYRNPLEDGRHRAAFILFNNFKKEFGNTIAGRMLIEWHQNQVAQTGIHKTTLTIKDINYIIGYHSNHNRYPGCAYIKDYMTSIGKKKVCDECPCNGKKSI